MISFLKNSKKNSNYSAIMIMAFPLIIQGLVFQLQSLTDKAFLGNLNTQYLSAIGASQFPLGTTLDTLVALCTGVTIVVSQMQGAKKTDNLISSVKSSIFYNSIISFFMFILWFFFSRYLFELMSVDEQIIDYCISYVRICSFYFLILGIESSLLAMLQGMGDTKPIMYSGIIKVFFNIFLSWVLIFGKLGFPALDIKGAALATVMANVMSSIMIIVYCFIIKRKTYRLIEGNLICCKLSSYKNIIKLGLPTGMEFLCWNMSNLILVKFLNSINYVATTIYTLTFCIEVFVYMIFNGIAKASLTLEGNKIGERDTDGARKIFNASMILNFIFVIVAIIIFVVFPKQLLSIFTNEASIITKSIPYLILTAFILIPKSINVIVGSGIRAYGDTKWMFYSQIIGSIFVVTCSFVLVQVLQLKVVAIYITLLLDESIRASINCYHYYKGNMKSNFVPITEELIL